jgi:cytidylate kinase
VIAIDGPAGAGKSTVAKRIAGTLGLVYLDTGAMYRAFTLYVLEKKINLEDVARIERAVGDFRFTISEGRVFVEEKDVTAEIRSEKVNGAVSYVSSLPFVRKKMVELQRQIGDNSDVVAEGRDIGTVVFPNATYKFYLDASIEERARRRMGDENNQDKTDNVSEMIDKINKRDRYDSTRDIAPLAIAEDAYLIDSTEMTIDEVCDYIISRIREKQPGAALYGESQHS